MESIKPSTKHINMKRTLSLIAVSTIIFSASPASAEMKLGGEAAVRFRDDFGHTKSTAGVTADPADQYFQYRVRLKPSADLGDGYFFKALIQNEENSAATGAVAAGPSGGWQAITANNQEKYQLEVSNFYFGRNLASSHYALGRLPLGTYNNPILDLTLYSTRPVDTPYNTKNFDRIFGFNCGTKMGGGELNATLEVFDNSSAGNTALTGDGLFNDGYALYLAYKTTIGDITVEPQAFLTLTHLPTATGTPGSAPYTVGAQAAIPSGKSKISLSGYYTADKNIVPNTATQLEYNGYLFRVKGESGPVMAWVDYNQTKDIAKKTDYRNTFVWAQYNVKLHESAAGSFSLTPTFRYRASGTTTSAGKADDNLLRTELYATVTF
jgi:hypothetical protein